MLIGQFYDMLHLYSLTGEPSEKHCLLMNGDLVDRGSWSIEVILTAFAYKCKFSSLRLCMCVFIYFVTLRPGLYPKRMYINRGNHEAKEMNRTYGFEGEAKHKHGEQTYKVYDLLLFHNDWYLIFALLSSSPTYSRPVRPFTQVHSKYI